MDALEKTLDFPQSFFGQGSPEYQAFREYAIMLSVRYTRNADLRESLTQEARDSNEDQIIRELNGLAHRMANTVSLKVRSDERDPGLTSPATTTFKAIVSLSGCYKEFGSAEQVPPAKFQRFINQNAGKGFVLSGWHK